MKRDFHKRTGAARLSVESLEKRELLSGVSLAADVNSEPLTLPFNLVAATDQHWVGVRSRIGRFSEITNYALMLDFSRPGFSIRGVLQKQACKKLATNAIAGQNRETGN